MKVGPFPAQNLRATRTTSDTLITRGAASRATLLQQPEQSWKHERDPRHDDDDGEADAEDGDERHLRRCRAIDGEIRDAARDARVLAQD
jgi:hypothetical protein